jgi:large subunit ribosomal protein L4
MAISATINFPVKTFDGQIKNEEVNLTLKIPGYYKSENLIDKSNYVIYRSLQKQLNNTRQGSRSTKTRAEVRGGGRKPWKQKGSGKARAGSNRSPLWKGGGVSFGPKPKVYSHKINRKEWKLSLRLLLLKKLNSITIVDNLIVNKIKTKYLYKAITLLSININKKTLIIVPEIDENLKRSSNNLKNIKILRANCLNIKDILDTKNIIMSKQSITIIEEKYNG